MLGVPERSEQSPSERIGALAQELMEQVDREHPGAELDQLVILAVLSEQAGDDEQSVQVQVVSDAPDPLSLVGLLTVALELAKGQLTEG
jgi:hypothetical protein